jgi:ADP-ribose pyrophosphatase
MDLKETLISSKKIFQGKIITFQQDLVLLENGKKASRDVVLHPGAVAVVAMTHDDKILFVRQYRHPISEALLEIPAGKLDKGEHPDDCARRELEEETGYVAGKLQSLTSIYTAPGFCNEIIHIYLATQLTKTTQHLDEDEFLKIEQYTKGEVYQMISDGRIHDAKSIVGLLMANWVTL